MAMELCRTRAWHVKFLYFCCNAMLNDFVGLKTSCATRWVGILLRILGLIESKRSELNIGQPLLLEAAHLRT